MRLKIALQNQNKLQDITKNTLGPFLIDHVFTHDRRQLSTFNTQPYRVADSDVTDCRSYGETASK
jgi:hypothetical protein